MCRMIMVYLIMVFIISYSQYLWHPSLKPHTDAFCLYAHPYTAIRYTLMGGIRAILTALVTKGVEQNPILFCMILVKWPLCTIVFKKLCPHTVPNVWILCGFTDTSHHSSDLYIRDGSDKNQVTKRGKKNMKNRREQAGDNS